MEENIENFKRVEISTMKNAGLFFAYEYPCGKISEDKRRLIDFENKMKKLFGEITQNSHSMYYQPEENQFVAVNPLEMKDWFRGYVLRRVQTNKGLEYKILLIDYGKEIIVMSNRLRKLPFDFSTERLQSQTLKIVLYGVMPTFLKIGIAEKSKYRKNDYWLPKDEPFVEEILIETNEIYFKEIHREEEYKFGILYLKNDESKISLQEMLIESNHAVECRNFENEIPKYIENLRKYSDVLDNKIRRDLFPNILFRNDTDTKTYTHNPGTFMKENNYEDYDNKFVFSDSESIISNLVSRFSDSVASLAETECSEISKYSSSTITSNSRLKFEENDCLVDKILIVGSNKENAFEPIHSFRNSALDVKTLEMLGKLKVTDLNRCQKYMIPAMLTEKNVILVDGPGSGKTLGALIGLISLLRNSKEKTCYGVGPRSIIVCPYSTRCEWIHKQCIKIITGKHFSINDEGEDLLVNVAYGCGTELEKQKLEELIRGYDILICTPRCLLRLLAKEEVFNFKRLSHIIFDEVHILLNSYHEETKEILEQTKKRQKPPQTVFISNYWSSEMKLLMKESLIMISCYLDAALFVQLKFVWSFISDETKKISSIIDLIKNDTRKKSVVVMLNEDDDLNFVSSKIQSACSRLTHKIENLDCLNLDIAQRWKQDVLCNRFPVLLCTDFTLPDLRIYEADCLIHYSLPTSKLDFLNRFCVLLNHLQTISDENSKNKNNITIERPVTFIYSSKENIEQFPAILDIMDKLRAGIPPEIKNCVKKLLRLKEIRKQEVDICVDLKQFGRCVNESRCEMRHEFLFEKDQPALDIPKSGYVKVHITHVHSPTHFSVRLLEHKTESSTWKSLQSPSCPVITAWKIKKYFSNRKNVKGYLNPNLGDVAAVELSPGSFKRVKMLKFKDYFTRMINEKQVTEPRKVTVMFIDEGKIMDVWIKDLLELPAQLASIPQSIVDVFVCNLLPVDEDNNWGEIIKKIIENEINQFKENAANFFCGKIMLVIGRSIWLHPFECKRWFSSMHEFFIQFSIEKTLLRKKLAVYNEYHLESLTEKCKLANLPINNGSTELISESSAKSSNNTSAVSRISTNQNGLHNKGVSTKLENNCNILLSKNENSDIPLEQKKIKDDIIFKKPKDLPAKEPIQQNQKQTFKPQVEWRQDLLYVYLTIHVNTEQFVVNYTNSNCIHFKAQMDNKVYEFNETFFACINSESSHYQKSGVTIRVKLAKLVKRENWKRLFKNREQRKWLKADQNFIGDAEEQMSYPHSVINVSMLNNGSKCPDSNENIISMTSDSEDESVIGFDFS